MRYYTIWLAPVKSFFVPFWELGEGAGAQRGAFNRSTQHHLTVVLKVGVYGRAETNETFFHREERHLGSLEGRAVHACDWARLWQATSHHSQAAVATWGHRSHCAPSLAASTHPRGARRYFARDRFRLVDSRDRPWSESCHLDSEPRDRTPWRPSCLSCP